MAQHDYDIANQNGAAFRTDLNNALDAIVTTNSGSTEPATTFAFQFWADTTANQLKMRNAANDGWIVILETDGEVPAKTFTGDITLNAQSDLRFADSDSSNWVAFQAPATVSSNVTWTLPDADATSSGQALVSDASGTLSWATAGGGDISDTAPERTFTNTTEEDTDGGRESKITFKGEQSGGEVSTLAQIEASHDGASDDEKGQIVFRTNDGSDGSSPTDRVTIDSAGNVGIGTSAPLASLHVKGPSTTSADTLRISTDFDGGAVENISIGLDKNVADTHPMVRIGVKEIDTGDRRGDLYFETRGADSDTAPTERMRIDNSGRVLIGQTDTTGINAEADNFVISANNPTGMTILSGDGGNCNINFADAGDDDVGRIRYNHSSNQLEFHTNANHRWNMTSNGDFTSFNLNTALAANFGAGFGQNGFVTIQRASGNGGNITFSVFQGTTKNIEMLANGTCSKPGGGSWTDINSERRLKQNLTLVDPTAAWETIRDLPYYGYSFIADPDELTHYGPVVDECPADMQVDVYEENEEGVQVIRSDEEGPLKTYNNELRDARLFVAVQESLKRIEALETTANALQAANDALTASVTALQAANETLTARVAALEAA